MFHTVTWDCCYKLTFVVYFIGLFMTAITKLVQQLLTRGAQQHSKTHTS